GNAVLIMIFYPAPVDIADNLTVQELCAEVAPAFEPGRLRYGGAQLKRGLTFSHSSCSDFMTFSCGILVPQFISHRMPSRPSFSFSPISRSVTRSGEPTMIFSRSASS